MSAEAVLEDSGFDWSSINMDDVQSEEGPLKRGSSSGSSSRTTTGKRRGRRSNQSRLDALQVTLSQQMFMGGTMVGMAMPVTGYYACQESDTFTKAVVELASKRPEWVEALEHLASLQPGLIVGRTALGLGASLAVDRSIYRARRGLDDPQKADNMANGQFMKFLGVYTAYMKAVNPDFRPEEGNAYKPPPSAFVGVE